MRPRTLRDRMFQSWWRLSRGATLGVRVIARAQDGRVALVRHTYTKGWHLPGGGVEKSETAYEAAVRELFEETGVEALADLKLRSVHANHLVFPGDHVLVFHASVDAPTPMRPTREIAEVAWVMPSALPDGATPGTRRRLAEAFFEEPISPNW